MENLFHYCNCDYGASHIGRRCAVFIHCNLFFPKIHLQNNFYFTLHYIFMLHAVIQSPVHNSHEHTSNKPAQSCSLLILTTVLTWLTAKVTFFFLSSKMWTKKLQSIITSIKVGHLCEDTQFKRSLNGLYTR